MTGQAFGHESHLCCTCGQYHVGAWREIGQKDVANVLRRTGNVRLLEQVDLRGWSPAVAVNITEDGELAGFALDFEVTAPETDAEGTVAFARLVLEHIKAAHREFEGAQEVMGT
jgi:hypothetical protein